MVYINRLRSKIEDNALTPRGESLMPHLVSLIGWALENFDAIVSDRNSLQATGPDL